MPETKAATSNLLVDIDNRPRSVLLVNQWHDDNRGDSAITLGLIRLIKRNAPDAEITVVGNNETGPMAVGAMRHIRAEYPSATLIDNPLPTELRGKQPPTSLAGIVWNGVVWAIRSLPVIAHVGLGARPPAALRRLVARSDLVIGIGGANLYDDPSVFPAQSWGRLLTTGAPIHAAIRSDTRTVLLGHTLGPWPRRAGTRLARRMIAGADILVARETSSAEFAPRLAPKQVEVAPDMAFAIEPTQTPQAEAVLRALPFDPARTLAISIRQHPSLGGQAGTRLRDEVAAAARRLYESGQIDGVMVVPHTVGPLPVEDDRPITAELRAMLIEAGVPVVQCDEDLSPSALSWLYGQVAVMIAVRLHAAILSIAAGTPVFAISYFSKKTEGVMRQVGLGDYVGAYDTVTGDDLVQGCSRLLADGDMRGRLERESAQRRSELEDRSRDWILASR